MKETIVKDKKFSAIISAQEIENSVKNLADRINADYAGREILFVGILNGAFIFAANLVKHITVPCTISFVKVSSYSGTSTTGKITELIGLSGSVAGKNVIVLEDVVDTGLTMLRIREQFLAQKPESFEIATLVFKPGSFREDFPVKYAAFNLPNDFIIGHGLDYDGYGRNLQEIYTLVE